MMIISIGHGKSNGYTVQLEFNRGFGGGFGIDVYETVMKMMLHHSTL